MCVICDGLFSNITVRLVEGGHAGGTPRVFSAGGYLISARSSCLMPSINANKAISVKMQHKDLLWNPVYLPAVGIGMRSVCVYAWRDL